MTHGRHWRILVCTTDRFALEAPVTTPEELRDLEDRPPGSVQKVGEVDAPREMNRREMAEDEAWPVVLGNGRPGWLRSNREL